MFQWTREMAKGVWNLLPKSNRPRLESNRKVGLTMAHTSAITVCSYQELRQENH